MREGDHRRMNINRHKWDESVPLHVASRAYDVPSFLRGRSTLRPLEIKELGPVRGRSLLHLQCHFGLDTLSWARRGARVTGVDFSLPAIRAARRMAREAGVQARFLQSNLYELTEVIDERFDIVYTGKGALCWLPDIEGWAEVVARVLKPGGRFFLLEDHPIAELFTNDTATGFELKNRYFGGQAIREEFDGTYATDAKMKFRVSYSWIHPVSTIVNALVERGLSIDSVKEYSYSYWHRYRAMVEDRHGWWHLTKSEGQIPLMLSLKARNRAAESRPRTGRTP
ncbi:MAG: class I SAM-dependent methyltransferase [Thermoplasmata archaeon]|nr:class I SAM-dependent methyltransferase [Thermoplasmata archaeon]